VAKLVTFPCLANTTAIGLSNTAITRASLAHLKKLSRLNHLDLSGCMWVDRAALTELMAGFRLQALVLKSCSAVGDAEMDLFATSKTILTLNVGGSPVTDAGIKKLEKLTQLEGFGAVSDGVTDDAMDTIVKFQELRDLGLSRGVTDTGLAKLPALMKLNTLWLDRNVRITDAGLVHLAKCKSLTFVSLAGTKVTKAGVEKLSLALPKCRIEYPGGVIEPKESPAPSAPMHADSAFPCEVVYREPFDKVPQDVATANGKQATAQSVNGVMEVRWPAGNRPPFSTFQYTFGPALLNPAFAHRMRSHGVD
jgi:hypothetical protein